MNKTNVTSENATYLCNARRLTAKRLLSVEEAAHYLGRTPGAIRELIYKGRLPVVKIDRRVQVDIQDLDLLVEKSKITDTTL